MALCELAKAGKHGEALKIIKRVWNVLDFLGKEGYAVATKAAARAIGVDLGSPRAPHGELPPEKIDELNKLIADTGLKYAQQPGLDVVGDFTRDRRRPTPRTSQRRQWFP